MSSISSSILFLVMGYGYIAKKDGYGVLCLLMLMFQAGQVSSYGLNSRISYSPKTELDYGNLFCWATNSVGRGSPCVFTILPIGPPDPPAKCRTSNVTYSSFEVRGPIKTEKR